MYIFHWLSARSYMNRKECSISLSLPHLHTCFYPACSCLTFRCWFNLAAYGPLSLEREATCYAGRRDARCSDVTCPTPDTCSSRKSLLATLSTNSASFLVCSAPYLNETRENFARDSVNEPTFPGNFYYVHLRLPRKLHFVHVSYYLSTYYYLIRAMRCSVDLPVLVWNSAGKHHEVCQFGACTHRSYHN